MLYLTMGQQLEARSLRTQTSETMGQNKALLFQVVLFWCFVRVTES